MVSIYNWSIRAYYLSLFLASAFSEKAALWIKGRKNWRQNLENFTSKSDNIIWFHCASTGEFEQGRPLIELIRNNHSSSKILVTFFSPSGYEMRKNYAVADHVCYLPIDTPANAKDFINLVNPALVIFIKYEFWYHYIHILNNNKVPFYFISAIFRKDQWLFKSTGLFMLKELKQIRKIFIQDDESGNLLQMHGLHNTIVAGDTRFDRVKTIAENVHHDSLIELFCKSSQVLVAGSTWEKDEEILSDVFNEPSLQLKMIIVPHELNAEHLSSLLNKFKGRSILYSECGNGDVTDFDVLIIDRMGMLSFLYACADFCYVGGGFGKGIHNILEAAAHGKPVLFGPHHRKFIEASALISCGGAFCIQNNQTLLDVLSKLIRYPEEVKSCNKASADFVTRNTGATSRIYDYIKNDIP